MCDGDSLNPVACPYRSGDLFAFRAPYWCHDPIGRGIQWFSCGGAGGYKHIAIAAPNPYTGELILWEATASLRTPCMIRGEPIKGMQAHPLQWRLEYAAKRGADVDLYRLKRPLKPEQARTLTAFLHRKVVGKGGQGTPYDYLGALWARSLCFGWAAHWVSLRYGYSRECLGNLFCSEVVGAALREAERWYTANASAWNPTQLVRVLVTRDDVVDGPFPVVRGGKVLA